MGVGKEHEASGRAPPEFGRTAKRRKLNNDMTSTASGKSVATAIDLTGDDSGYDDDAKTQLRSYRPSKENRKRPQALDEEKRLRHFRSKPPQAFLEREHRALTQRMFVLDRRRQGTFDAPEEVFVLAGTTGNVYTVKFNKMPSCTCPDNIKGNQCKHIIYVVCNVLKATGKLRYQLAYLSSELREIFNQAPSPFSIGGKGAGQPSHQKPIEGDCPICFEDMEPDGEEILFCRAACGNNLHKACFKQWISSCKTSAAREVRCVYCRAPWQGDEDSIEAARRALVKGSVGINSVGYLNVADELRISQARDYNTYHQPWVMSRGRTVRYGNLL